MKEYATMWLEANKEETSPNWWIWGEDNLKKMQQGYEGAYNLFNTDFYIFNANRLDEMFATRYSHQHNLSISNSNDKSGYRLSFDLPITGATWLLPMMARSSTMHASIMITSLPIT